jgi:hypothetical protein
VHGGGLSFDGSVGGSYSVTGVEATCVGRGVTDWWMGRGGAVINPVLIAMVSQ